MASATVKKPLFKRQAKAIPKPQSAVVGAGNLDKNDDDGLSLFKRSKEFFPVVLQDQVDEARRKDAAAQQAPAQKQDRKRPRPSQSGNDSGEETDIYGVSDEEKDPQESSRQQHRPLTPSPSKAKSQRESATPSTARRLDKGKCVASPYKTPTKQTHQANGASSSAGDVHAISDSDEEIPPRKRNTPRRVTRNSNKLDTAIPTDDSDDTKGSIVILQNTKPIPLDDDDIAEVTAPDDINDDPEFAHFVIEAQKRHADEKAAKAAKAEQEALADNGITSAPCSVPVGDRIITVLITSGLPPPEMEPIVIQTRLHKRVNILRDAVLSHSRVKGRPLDPHEKESLFLTWKGRKLFDTTTLLSLGIIPDADGQLSVSPGIGSRSTRQSEGVTDGALHLEMHTEETLGAWKKDQEKQRQRDLGVVLSDDEAAGPETVKSPAAGDADANTPGSKIRIVMKAKNMEPFKFSAQPTTEISFIIAAFRKVRKVDAARTVTLMFDGETLGEKDTIGDVDIEDMDSLDVLIK